MAKSTGKSLVIVESPAKARTISKYLGSGYQVEASIGHVRDLPAGKKEVPEKFKSEPWAYLGVDIDHDFEPLYIVPDDKKKQVKKLKDALKMYKTDHGKYPKQLDITTLRKLENKGYLMTIPQDPGAEQGGSTNYQVDSKNRVSCKVHGRASSRRMK